MAITASQFKFISDFIRKHSGIVLEVGKEYLVESRLRQIVSNEGFADFAELVTRLKANGNLRLQEKVVAAMTTNETSFFRDQHPFEVLRDTVLPELIEKRAAQKMLNIWCAASSTGQEPYTIAMTLVDHFPELASWKITLLATDLSEDVLAKAREGKFVQIEVNRGLPEQLLIKHFKKSGLEWQLSDQIRKMVEFRQMNLTAPWPAMFSVDILFMRNVLIYFDAATKQSILTKARNVLRSDGYLFLGGTETTLGFDDAFERLPIERSGCYRLAIGTKVSRS
jgi:chemotaxis protein methyltransferase CheR